MHDNITNKVTQSMLQRKSQLVFPEPSSNTTFTIDVLIK